MSDLTLIPVARFVDLSVFIVAFEAHLQDLDARGSKPTLATQKGMALLKRYKDEIAAGFMQHVEPLTERNEAASLKSKLRLALRATTVSPVAISYWADALNALYPWARGHSTIFNTMFTGRAVKAARELAVACSEEALPSKLNKCAGIASVSGVSVFRKILEVYAQDAGASLSSTESILTDAESAQHLGTDLRSVDAKIAVSIPNTPEAADLQTAKTGILTQLELIAKDALNPTVVYSAAAASATGAQPKSSIAQRFHLTDEQAEVADTMGKVLVAAGAGSGKTSTTVATIVNLVENKGFSPGQILACSFTRAASSELASRIENAGKINGVAVGTTHKVARDIITNNRPEWIRAMRNTKGADKCFKMALKQVEMSVNDFKKQVDMNKGVLELIESIRNWRNFDILRSFHDQASRGRPLSEKQLGVIDRFRTPQKRWASELDFEWDKLASGDADDAPSPRGFSKYWTQPVGEWFNLGKPITNEEGQKIGQKAALLMVDNFKNSDISVEEARKERGDNDPIVALYGAYEFLKRNDPVYGPAMDYTDQLQAALHILKSDPKALANEQARYRAVIVDEAQDLNQTQFNMFNLLGGNAELLSFIGDDFQCVASDTLITTPHGSKRADELKLNEIVLSYRNGKIETQKVRHIVPTQWKEGIRITTDGGRTLTMSPNHKIWATEPVTEENEVAVYLMYRKDMGYRIGITNKGKTGGHRGDHQASYGGRAFSEKAERMWILDICSDREQALLKEETYSLQYGVPTCVFSGETRGINQDRIDAVYKIFGANGAKILQDKHLSFDNPHWMSQSFTKHGRLRRTVHLVAHSAAGSHVRIEWTGDSLDAKLQGQFKLNGEYRRLRRWFNNYREALQYALMVTETVEGSLRETLSTPEIGMPLMTASGLLKGMKVAVLDSPSTGIVLETITSVETVPASFLDLDIEDASNFFGNGILSHNSIYRFRGAKPENYVGLSKHPDFQVKKMTTNFRSGSAIVEAANTLIAHNGDRQVQKVCKANPSRGVGSIAARRPATHEDAAQETAQVIRDAIDAGESASDFGITVRNNAEADAFTIALVGKGVPYRTLKKEQGGYFGKPVVRALTAWIRLAIGGTTQEMNDAVVEAHRTPGFGMDEMFGVNLGRVARGMNYYDYIASGQEVYSGQSAWLNKRVAEYVDAIREVKTIGGGSSLGLIRAILDLKSSKGSFEDSLVRMVDEGDVLEGDGEETEDAVKNAAMAPIRPLMLMAENFTDPENMLGFITKMKAANEKVEKQTPQEKDDWKEPAVLIGSVHSWKGLEAKHVYVVMSGGVFPNFRSDRLFLEGDDTAFDEERRLAYVAITRGRDTTTVLAPKMNYLGKEAKVSRFVEEACLRDVDQVAEAMSRMGSVEGIEFDETENLIAALEF